MSNYWDCMNAQVLLVTDISGPPYCRLSNFQPLSKELPHRLPFGDDGQTGLSGSECLSEFLGDFFAGLSIQATSLSAWQG